MLAIDNTLLSDDIKNQHFVCDLAKCKGACCVEGDSGAPIDIDEMEIMEDEHFLKTVFPYLTQEGKDAIQNQGPFYLDKEVGEMKVTLKNDNACAFVNYKNGITYCGIERAWLDKKIDFRKPISCHLYPIRIKKYPDYDALNYEEWDICKDACTHGDALKIPLYKFAKEALIRKYGKEYYEKLEATIAYLDKNNEQ
ncbi:MAG: DUF3109 family protein [Chitinophagales bacterium]|nr:DUF3109 family protein [Chitinophagales bacterium]